MSKSIKIELNSDGIRALLRSSETKEFLVEKANEAQKALGEGYEVTSYTGKNRANASIKAMTQKAYKEQLESNAILKALFGGK